MRVEYYHLYLMLFRGCVCPYHTYILGWVNLTLTHLPIKRGAEPIE